MRYNNRSAAPLDLPEEMVIPYYRAYRRFGRLLHDPQATAGFRLTAGDLFIVDNRRVLHGRRGFGSGRRHLQGAYADKDSLLSKLRVAGGAALSDVVAEIESAVRASMATSPTARA